MSSVYNGRGLQLLAVGALGALVGGALTARGFCRRDSAEAESVPASRVAVTPADGASVDAMVSTSGSVSPAAVDASRARSGSTLTRELGALVQDLRGSPLRSSTGGEVEQLRNEVESLQQVI